MPDVHHCIDFFISDLYNILVNNVLFKVQITYCLNTTQYHARNIKKNIPWNKIEKVLVAA